MRSHPLVNAVVNFGAEHTAVIVPAEVGNRYIDSATFWPVGSD